MYAGRGEQQKAGKEEKKEAGDVTVKADDGVSWATFENEMQPGLSVD